jgi:predicted acylesterase/phospholipase RssA
MPTIRPINLIPSLHPHLRGPSNLSRFNGSLAFAPTDSIKVDGVLEGGAALGAAYLGSLRLMEQHGIWFARVAGNSAGSITAALIAAGYRAGDIEWLCSAFPNTPPRPSGVPASLQPIDFLDFLDFPTLASVGNPARRKTLLWKSVKGQVLDNILETKIPLIPTRSESVTKCVSDLKKLPVIGHLIGGHVENSLRTALNGALAFLPASPPKLKDFQLFNTEPIRIALADAVWSAVASVNPLLLLTTQFLHEGSIFEGKVFLQTMKRLLGAKVHNNPNADVLFSQLPIPFACIGANISTKRMEVYSSATTPNMEVAEAVRRSMSLPVIFQPRGNVIVDGGICSNLPAWLFSPSGDSCWPAASIDAARPKIAFTLDETALPPTSWGVGAGKFAVGPNGIDLKAVLTPLILAKLKEQAIYVPNPTFKETEVRSDLDNLKVLEVAIGSATMNQEDSVRRVILRGLFANSRFFSVNIPLSGFHGFDFAINGDQRDVESIAERGWFAARDALAANPFSGLPLIANPNSQSNPY